MLILRHFELQFLRNLGDVERRRQRSTLFGFVVLGAFGGWHFRPKIDLVCRRWHLETNLPRPTCDTMATAYLRRIQFLSGPLAGSIYRLISHPHFGSDGSDLFFLSTSVHT